MCRDDFLLEVRPVTVPRSWEGLASAPGTPVRQAEQHMWEVASLPAGDSLHMLSGTGCQAGRGLRLPEHLVGRPQARPGKEGVQCSLQPICRAYAFVRVGCPSLQSREALPSVHGSFLGDKEGE